LVWREALAAGTSISLHGYGAKAEIADAVAAVYPGRVLRLEGAAFTEDVQDALQQVAASVSQRPAQARRGAETATWADAVHATVDAAAHLVPTLIVIHDVDAPAFRSANPRAVFREIDARSAVFLTTSTHPHASLSSAGPWGLPSTSWVAADCTTFLPARLFPSMDCFGTSQKTATTRDGLKWILRSLTPNHKAILRIMAEYATGGEDEDGVEFEQLFGECVDQMIISNDAGLRAHLVELIDHQLLSQRRGKLHLEVAAGTLQVLLED
jgi:origin recognition complex subunit 2